MVYIAQKPCSFAGKRYRIGEPIPDGVILPLAIKRLLTSGVIAESGAGFLLPASASLDKEVSIPLVAENRGNEIKLTVEQLVEVVKIVQMTEEEIIASIDNVTSEEQLILIDALSKSKAVYEAAEFAAKKLIGEPEEGHLDPKDLSAMNYNDLKKLAKDMGVSAAGTKEELIERISAEGVYVEGEQ